MVDLLHSRLTARQGCATLELKVAGISFPEFWLGIVNTITLLVIQEVRT
jgi:hypothetical protein